MSTQTFETYLSFRDTAGKFLGYLNQPMVEKLTAMFDAEGASEDFDSYFAQVTGAVSPDEISFEGLHQRGPYTNPKQYKKLATAAAERGWVSKSETGLTATEKSVAFADKLVALLEEELKAVEANLSVDIVLITKQLARLVEAAGALAYKPSYTFALSFEYEDRTPSLLWIRRHAISLNAFRDDCHLASWQKFDLPGYVWETLSFIWEGNADTAAELAETLPFRGYEELDYAQAVEQLIELGWVELKDEKVQVTEKGKTVRQEAEDQTNAFYKAGLDALTAKELKELTTLIDQLAEAIKPEEKEEE